MVKALHPDLTVHGKIATLVGNNGSLDEESFMKRGFAILKGNEDDHTFDSALKEFLGNLSAGAAPVNEEEKKVLAKWRERDEQSLQKEKASAE